MEEEQLPPMEEATDDEPSITRDRDDRIVMAKAVKEEESKRKKEVGLRPPIRWRKGELIGCSAFGRVHMGMNLDSGELLAVKEVAIGATALQRKHNLYFSISRLMSKGDCEGNPDYECLRAELRKMAPPNGRAVLLFHDKCGCPIAKLERWGPKRGRRHKKSLALTSGGDQS